MVRFAFEIRFERGEDARVAAIVLKRWKIITHRDWELSLHDSYCRTLFGKIR